MGQIFVNAAEVDEIKQKVAGEEWAAALLKRLQKSIEAGKSTPEEEE